MGSYIAFVTSLMKPKVHLLKEQRERERERTFNYRELFFKLPKASGIQRGRCKCLSYKIKINLMLKPIADVNKFLRNQTTDCFNVKNKMSFYNYLPIL